MEVTGIPYNVADEGFGAGDLLLCWLALAVMTLVFVAVAAAQLSRTRTG